MRASEARKMFEKLENIEAETKSIIEIIMQGAKERLVVWKMRGQRLTEKEEE